jgi:lipopolysaccharide export system permease protein
MTILDRYIARSIVVWTFVALVVLVSLRAFNVFVDETGDTGIGNFQTLDALQVTVLKAPVFVVEVFPVAALLGGLLALGGMARHTELTAMRTAGVSIWRILGSVTMAGLALAVLVVVVSEFVAPATEQRAEQLKAERMNQPSVLRSSYGGYWMRDGSNFVNIQQVFAGGSLGSISVFELDEAWQLKSMTWAKTGEFVNGTWLLRGVIRALVTPEKVETQGLPQWESPLRLKPAFIDLVAVKPLAMSALDLYHYLRFLAANEQSQPEYEVALWNKVTTPVTTLILLVLAVAFVLGNLRNVDIGQRILAGAVTGTVFAMLNRAASFVAIVYNIPPGVAAWLPPLVFLVITLFYLKRLA